MFGIRFEIKDAASNRVGVHEQSGGPREQTNRRDPPAELDWSGAAQCPLPPSPASWEVDGRGAINQQYDDPVLGQIFRAALTHQFTKLVKLASALSPAQRRGDVGALIARAYRRLIRQQLKSGHLAGAAKRCAEMFEHVPADVQDVDRRRFNKILTQMERLGRKHHFTRAEATVRPVASRFAVADGSRWTLEERRLRDNERPDPAFEMVAFGEAGSWFISRPSKDRPGTLLKRFNRSGQLVAEKRLTHDVYRTGSGVTGSSFAILDSNGVLHIYDQSLKVVRKSDLRADHRVVDHFETVNAGYWGGFKSHVRAVDVAADGKKYLFTIADEAWCCTLQGETVWGVAVPLKEGWKRVTRRRQPAGESAQIADALELLGLSPPVSPAAVKRRYRERALACHPDRNPNRPTAAEDMKALNHAFEVLTGDDPNTLELEAAAVTEFERTDSAHLIEVEGFRIEMSMDGENPQDWVYAATFAASNGGVYLATRSGKVVLLSESGAPLKVFEIGSCPREIVDSGRYTYILTSTRLYLVEDGARLAAFIDVFQQGRLIVGASGFGLLATKKLQWFSQDGRKAGELVSQDPIRAIFAVDDGAIVLTRQHQARLRGPAL